MFCIYAADQYLSAINCWHFNIYEQDKSYAQLSLICLKKTSGPAQLQRVTIIMVEDMHVAKMKKRKKKKKRCHSLLQYYYHSWSL